MRFGSLFSGIGGMDLGLERAGMKCIWQVEIDEYASKVLAKHWPDVQRFRDVRDVGIYNLEPVDLIAGGFPCQDLSASQTGKRLGLDGARSGLWTEFARVLRELRPRFALVENSPMLLNRGLDRILCDLAALGYDASWSTLSACSLGASHPRERLFILAHPASDGWDGWRFSERSAAQAIWNQAPVWESCAGPIKRFLQAEDWEAYQTGVHRRTNGLSSKVDRARGLGNAVVPHVAEYIGRRIMEAACPK